VYLVPFAGLTGIHYYYGVIGLEFGVMFTVRRRRGEFRLRWFMDWRLSNQLELRDERGADAKGGWFGPVLYITFPLSFLSFPFAVY